jgi:hypothetical protein
MHRGVPTSIILVPLVIGLGFLIFAMSTEWWTRVDTSKIKNLNNELEQSEFHSSYVVTKRRFEIPKYLSLYGQCDEIQFLDVLEPINTVKENTSIGIITDKAQLKLSNRDQCLTVEMCEKENGGSECFCCASTRIDQVPVQMNLLNNGEYDDDDNPNMDFKNDNPTITKLETTDVETLKNCCYPISKRCDGTAQCADQSDELKKCPSYKLFYTTIQYDEKNKCIRHQYKLWDLVKR